PLGDDRRCDAREVEGCLISGRAALIGSGESEWLGQQAIESLDRALDVVQRGAALWRIDTASLEDAQMRAQNCQRRAHLMRRVGCEPADRADRLLQRSSNALSATAGANASRGTAERSSGFRFI